MREKNIIEEMGLRNTTDSSRTYPQPERRFLSSPLV